MDSEQNNSEFNFIDKKLTNNLGTNAEISKTDNTHSREDDLNSVTSKMSELVLSVHSIKFDDESMRYGSPDLIHLG